MKIKKVNLDRKPLESGYIQQKQDFQQLMSMYKKVNIPVWKQPLFYGVVGFASVAAVVVSSLFDFNSVPIEKIHTQIEKENKPETPVKSNLIADSQEVSGHTLQVESPTTNKELSKPVSEIRLKKELSDAKEIKTNSPIVVEEHVRPEVYEQRSKAIIPNIAGKSQGNIKASQLCSEAGVEMDADTKITSFHIMYSVGLRERVVSVKGSRVPEEVCKELERSGYEQMVFITEIIGVKEDRPVALPSLNFWVIKG
jgi:hypothetical protein